MAGATLALALAVGTMSMQTSAVLAYADDLEDKKKQVEQRVEVAEEDLDESSAALRKASVRLAAAQEQLAAAKVELATARGKLEVAEERDAVMQAALETAEAELATAEAELAQGRLDRDAQRQRVATTVAEMYMDGDPDLIAFTSLMDAESSEELTRRDGVRDVVVGQEARAYDELKAAEVMMVVREDQVERARDAVAGKRAEAAEHLVLMQELETEKAAASASVRSLVEERAAARAEASAARAADAAKLRALQRQQDEIEEMLRRRAEAALRRARAAAAAKAASARARSAVSGPSGGVLSYPVDGYVTSPFGYRTHPIHKYWGMHDGVDFGGGCGTPLRAAAQGRVVASYWSAVYGNRLVVDHGAHAGVGLATVYNHASDYTVDVGTQVTRGQVIGFEGSTGWSTGCHLHFTVMANGRPVDPMNWF